jgi:hypothetical protein
MQNRKCKIENAKRSLVSGLQRNSATRILPRSILHFLFCIFYSAFLNSFLGSACWQIRQIFAQDPNRYNRYYSYIDLPGGDTPRRWPGSMR